MTHEYAERPRRLRQTPALRDMVAETRLSRRDLIQPLFVVERAGDAGPVPSMPGVERLTVDGLRSTIERLLRAGIRGTILFGVPASKDAAASSAHAADGVIPRAVEAVRRTAGADMVIFTDVCLCQYTDHGHCGMLQDGRIDNDATLPVLAMTAVAHAQAGADFVAPSGMMDGAVRAIRTGLDAAGHVDVGILAYAVKYASGFYGPFRDAAESAPRSGDRRSYQMDSRNVREALREARLDWNEGADILMVKPALPYLDVLRRVRDAFPDAPLAAYQVSGEYSMIKAAAERGWLDERTVAVESLTAIKRAGAGMILTYFAEQAAGWLE